MYYRYKKTGEIYIHYISIDENGSYKEEYHSYNSSNKIILSKIYMPEDVYMGWLYQVKHSMQSDKDKKELKDYQYKLYISAVDKVKGIAQKIFEEYYSISAANCYHDVNELNLKGTDIKEYIISSDITEYTTDEKPVYDYKKIPENIKIVTGLKCPMCESEMKCDPESQFQAFPKYRYVCPKCGYVSYLDNTIKN